MTDAPHATPPPAEDELPRLRARLADLEGEVVRLRGIVRQARDIIVTTDLEGHITEWNDEAEQVLGWSAAFILLRWFNAAHWVGLFTTGLFS